MSGILMYICFRGETKLQLHSRAWWNKILIYKISSGPHILCFWHICITVMCAYGKMVQGVI